MTAKAERADYVVVNDYDLTVLSDQVDRLWRRLQELSQPGRFVDVALQKE
jgi:hypothetical protein